MENIVIGWEKKKRYIENLNGKSLWFVDKFWSLKVVIFWDGWSAREKIPAPVGVPVISCPMYTCFFFLLTTGWPSLYVN
jgi:hypothetical protein